MFFRSMLFISISTSPAFAADPLAELSQNYPVFSKGQFNVTAKISHNSITPPGTIRSTRVYVDLPRWKLFDKESTTSLKDGKTSTYSIQGESLVHLGGKISVSADYATGRAIGGIAAHVKALPADEVRWAGYGMFSFAFDARTQMNNALTLPEILAQSETHIEQTTLTGKAVVLLSAKSKWGKLSLWLDPSRNYIPLKVVQEKTAGHLVDENKPLSSISRNDDGKQSQLAEFTQRYETSRISVVNGQNMITGFTHHTSQRAQDGSKREDSEEVLLTDIKRIDKWDKDPFVPTTIIPDGTRVTAQDDQPIEYEWRGGKIVKLVNQPAVASAGAQQFVPPAASANPWLWLAGGAGVLALVGGIVWRARRARGAA